MSNKTKQAKAPAAPATEAPKAKSTVTVIKVLKADGKFRGAREAWYKELVAHDGKPVKDFIDHVTAKPPSTPKKGKLQDKLEPPTGWLSWFKRQGIIAMPEA